MQKKIVFIGIALMAVFHQCIPNDDAEESAFQQRSEIIISETADNFAPPPLTISDPEKFYWPKTMARFEKYGLHDSLANGWIENLKNRSPFHFTLVGMARLMSMYGEAPAIKNNKKLLLQKVFERSDGHNPWTSEGTENHLAMDRTSGYLYAQHALDFPDDFPDAAEKMQLIKNWIEEWSRKIYHYGTGEWNSSTYQAYHIIGWLNLYDFALDTEVQKMARAVLDYYAAEMALHYSWGTYGGSEKRGRGAVDVNLSASNYLCWLWFGSHYDGDSFLYQGREYIQSIHAATSSYRPPHQILAIARKETTSPAWYVNSKPSYLFEQQSFVKQFFYIDDNFTLGTAVSPYGGWTGATYQLVNWKLAVKSKMNPVPFEISGNGRFHDNWSGSTGNPWTQFAQHKNVLVQLTHTPENKQELIDEVRKIVTQWAVKWQRDFSKRFPDDNKPNVVNFARNIVAENLSFINLPEEVEYIFVSNVCFIEMETVYLTIQFLASDVVNEQNNLRTINGRKVLTDQVDDGQLCGFVLEVTNKEAFNGINDLITQYGMEDRLERNGLTVNYSSLMGDNIKVTYTTDGTFEEAIYDWGYGATKPQTLVTAPPFRQPDWPVGEGYGKVPFVKINGDSLDLKGVWPVFDGPDFTLKNGVLRVKNSSSAFEVDYSGSLPFWN